MDVKESTLDGVAGMARAVAGAAAYMDGSRPTGSEFRRSIWEGSSWGGLCRLGRFDAFDVRAFAAATLEESLREISTHDPEWYNDDTRLGRSIADAVKAKHGVAAWPAVREPSSHYLLNPPSQAPTSPCRTSPTLMRPAWLPQGALLLNCFLHPWLSTRAACLLPRTRAQGWRKLLFMSGLNDKALLRVETIDLSSKPSVGPGVAGALAAIICTSKNLTSIDVAGHAESIGAEGAAALALALAHSSATSSMRALTLDTKPLRVDLLRGNPRMDQTLAMAKMAHGPV